MRSSPMQTALQIVDVMAERSGWLGRALSAQRLMAIARQRTGLADFGAAPITEALQRLLDAAVAETPLSVVGRIALRWDTLRFLTNLLALNEAERRAPEIRAEPIAQPIFITGLPRSGTTFLHRMMLCDPANRAPLVFETIFPIPPQSGRDGGGKDGGGKDRREARVARQLRRFEWLAPKFHELHHLSAGSPQECTEILAHTFRSLRFDTTYRIPSYRHWLEAEEARHLPAYQMHKRFLQHLQYQGGQYQSGQYQGGQYQGEQYQSGPYQNGPNQKIGGGRRRWVLKCPDHLFALATLRAVYPDARIVFVHRDPLKVLLSVAKLTEVVRRTFSRRVDRIEIGRNESARWLEGAGRMLAESRKGGSASAIFHVHYLDLIADPAASVAALYRHFGLVLPEAAAAAIRATDAAEPGGGYGPRHYRFAEHGLDAAAEWEKFRPYMQHFAVTPESLEETGALPARSLAGRGSPQPQQVPGELPGGS